LITDVLLPNRGQNLDGRSSLFVIAVVFVEQQAVQYSGTVLASVASIQKIENITNESVN